MILPLSVMNVIPTATQPMKDVVFSSENRLTVVKKPGVATAATTSASIAAKRMATSTRPRVECGTRQAPDFAQSRGACRLLAHAALSAGMRDVGDDAMHRDLAAADSGRRCRPR